MAEVVSQAISAVGDASNRRRSGRQVRKPEHFGGEEHVRSVVTNGSAKRKRINQPTANGVSEEEDDSESSEEEEDESEPDEEELKERRRANRAKKASSKQPATKKAKTNGAGPSLAIRTANNATQKGKKVQKARARQSQMNEEGLYGMLSLDGRNTLLTEI